MKNLTITTVTPKTVLGNPMKNAENIIEVIKNINSDIIVFPELSLTGVNVGDFVYNKEFIKNEKVAFDKVKEEVKEKLIILGSIEVYNNKIFNVIYLLYNKNIIGITKKNYIDDRNKLELRSFSNDIIDLEIVKNVHYIEHLGLSLGIDFNNDNLDLNKFDYSLYNSDLIINPSSSVFAVRKDLERINYIKTISNTFKIPYVYVTNGICETSSDVVYSGTQIVYNKEMELLNVSNLSFDNVINTVFIESNDCESKGLKLVNTLENHVMKYPFRLNSVECEQVCSVTAAALYKRLNHIGINATVIGVSGGLDSTLALMFLYDCYKKYNIPTEYIYGITMPGLATGDKTKNIAWNLMTKLGITCLEKPIKVEVENHLKLIGHDGVTKDVTYENAQARYRTYILMNYANLCKGLVIGTSDMSEIALGWSTFNGDQIAMYGLISGIPKTTVKELVKYYSVKYPIVKEELEAVLDLPITPELTGNDQFTEDLIGRYDINDFIMYYMFNENFSKDEILEYATLYFDKSSEEISLYYDRLLRRFKQNQFKRYASCEGIKIFDLSLSPRVGYIFPGDMK